MDPKVIIDSYVGDVVRYLPRRQRADVARELRSLLDDELAGRAAEAGRSTDSVLTMGLLTEFGRPQEVADRYRPAGFTIIRPSDAPRFTWLTLGGVALIWAITLPAALLGITPVIGWDYGADEWWGRLTAWWFGPGLGALWWPGVMITYVLIGALVDRRRESTPKAWAPASPRAIDRDLVSRSATVAALGAALLGATVVVALPWLATWAPGLPAPVRDALALDPEFLRLRAPWVLLAWAAPFALQVVVLIAGRWTANTLRVRGVLDLVMVGLLLWWTLGGVVFVSAEADSTAKFLFVALGIVAAIDAVVALRRSWSTSRHPSTLE
ncbi:hypothetical protein GCM10027416_08670 [Okibacterium endophyticum]